MCYNDACTSQHELVEGLLDGKFALSVECAGGFVEDENRRVFEYSAGNAEALPLSTTEGNAAVTYIGIVALRELGDEFVGMGNGGGAAHLFGTVTCAAEGYIVDYGVVEEDAVLRDKTNLGAQTIDVEIAHGGSIDEYLSVSAVIKTWQEIDKGGLASTRRPYDGDGLAAGDVKVDVAEDVDGVGMAVCAVCKRYVAVLYAFEETLEDDGVVFLDDGFVGVHNLKDACSGGVGFL